MTDETLGTAATRAVLDWAKAIGQESYAERTIALVKDAAMTWFDKPRHTRFPVFLLDGSCFELCLHLPPHDVGKMRFTLEPIGEKASVRSYWDGGVRSIERIGSTLKWEVGPLLELLEAVSPKEDFALDENVLKWAMWIGGAVGPDPKDTTVKIYISLGHAYGRGLSIQDIARRAGIGDLAASFSKVPDRRFGMMTVDLGPSGVSRTKFYAIMMPSGPHTPQQFDELGALTNEYRKGDAKEFLEMYAPEALARGEGHLPFVASTLHAVEGSWNRLTTTVGYEAENRPPDDVLVARTLDVIRRYKSDEATYHKFAEVVGARNASVLSMQRQKGVPMLTMYAAIPVFDDHAAVVPRGA